ncbi:Sulfoxide reductase catalytic subunit YedY precursor [Planctomycetes bacterium Pan216]|uniref:Sulfoxide reductase catalytic subunit YedY n=1 Tax=Kolteria novifilia TaxID=2527975 RepID=A0A518B0Z8_9BACT|nr:Sulfoxide reductase catalytic subunit YedY precursor [Planctomycetes bacterium Pan216]
MKDSAWYSQPVDRRAFLAWSAATAGMILAPRFGMAADPMLHGKDDLKVLAELPLNAEPKLGDLIKSWVTPIKYFYARNHAPVPAFDASDFKLEVSGLVNRPMTIGIGELVERFSPAEATLTMTCAGNRRSEHSKTKRVSGVQWEAGTIGNAIWSGPKLSDLLQAVEVKPEAKHVQFLGLDQIERGRQTINFGASIPLEKAMSDADGIPGTLLATKMNGEVLPPEHGHPVRTVVPGYIGARSVKWLGKIVISDRPSDNHYVARAYKLVTQGDAKEWEAASILYDFPPNSAICLPHAGATLKPGLVPVRGYALPGGFPDRTIAKVEISADGGNRWTEAKIVSPNKPFCWSFWEAKVKVTPMTKSLIVRATDSSGKMQPKKVDWNIKGYFFNAWQEIPVTVG